MADKLDNQQQQSYDEEQDFHNARKQVVNYADDESGSEQLIERWNKTEAQRVLIRRARQVAVNTLHVAKNASSSQQEMDNQNTDAISPLNKRQYLDAMYAEKESRWRAQYAFMQSKRAKRIAAVERNVETTKKSWRMIGVIDPGSTIDVEEFFAWRDANRGFFGRSRLMFVRAEQTPSERLRKAIVKSKYLADK